MRIAMISQHASPLAALGGVDVGGQNVHVAELAAAMARGGHRVTVYTRRDDRQLPECVETPQGYTVVHVPAGPAEPLPNDELLCCMGDFAGFLDDRWRIERPGCRLPRRWDHLVARGMGPPWRVIEDGPRGGLGQAGRVGCVVGRTVLR